MSVYLLPDGNVQVAFSGGRSSAYLLRKLIEANGEFPDRVVVTFQNTGRERWESLDFVAECALRWGEPVTWLEYRPSTAAACPFDAAAFCDKYASIFGVGRLDYMRAWWKASATDARFCIVDHASASRTGKPFEAMVLSRRYLPNQQTRFCTTELKVRAAKRYLISLGWKHWTNCVGFRADEKHRLNKPAPKDRWTVWHPMSAAGVGKMDVADFWKRQPFDLRLPNVKGKCWLGNCDGCFLKSEKNIASFHRDYAGDAFWWEGMEALVSWMTNSSSVAFWSKRYSRSEMRRYMERQGDWALSTDGALCQKDEGECFG